ncbi:unnamed protein product [Mytilus edulis]|uniref:Endonuclease/exonuclease/phosphatase domain-containing protein n=1 Tax=Mytilus edulis TaxID=6550 RepID=A0A8S3UM45_MYTED|nr:unnamed protein product [Mytilus edulis]
MRNTQQTNPPPNWYGMPGHTTHATYQPTPPPVYQHMRPQVVINPYGRQPYQAMPATNLQHPSIPSFIQRSRQSGLDNQNANITIGTLNIQNIKGNSIYLQTILKSLDILCIQEHWILSLEKNIIKNINNDFISYVKSVDDEDPIIDHKAIRGYGGTAIFWNKDLEKSINIMPDAFKKDSKTFHKLVKQQRSKHDTNTDILYIGNKAFEGEKILSAWQTHFETLGTPNFDENIFDLERLELSKLQNNIIPELDIQNKEITKATPTEIESAIRKLNTGKASDENGIVSEHYIHAIDVITDEITDIINQIFEKLDVPQI